MTASSFAIRFPPQNDQAVAVMRGSIRRNIRRECCPENLLFCVHGVISPVLANLFLHYVFDRWMRKHHPEVPFERYADDVICHCKSEAHACSLKQELEARMAECLLEPHPEKTRIVYCKDANRRGIYPICQFNFLGYTFRARSALNRMGKLFASFTPAVSNKAATAMPQDMRRRGWPGRHDFGLDELADKTRPILRGWIQYFSTMGGFIDRC